jgi:AcrR family transcriptional regulator
MSASETRAGIVAAADDLFYRQGYAQTSFADIAAAVDLSRGNFYYHFRSKDEILAAVIAARLDKTARMLADWEKAATDPLARIRCFIDIVIRNRDEIKHFGCPVGSLTTELAKLGQQGGGDARRIFICFRAWLVRQFAALGLAARAADEAALHLLAWSQGVAVLANVFHDEAFIRREAREIEARLQSLLPSGRRTGRQRQRNSRRR